MSLLHDMFLPNTFINDTLTSLVMWLIKNQWIKDIRPKASQFPVWGKGPFGVAFFDDGTYFITNVYKSSDPKNYRFESVDISGTKTLVKVVGYFDHNNYSHQVNNIPLMCGDSLSLSISRS